MSASNQSEENNHASEHSNSEEDKKSRKRKKIRKLQKLSELQLSAKQNKITDYFIKKQRDVIIKKTNRLGQQERELVMKYNSVLQELNEQDKYYQQKLQQMQDVYQGLQKEVLNFKKKSKKLIAQAVSDNYEIRRKQKGQLDYGLGYYRVNSTQFVQGQKKTTLINKKSMIIKQLQKIQDFKEVEQAFLRKVISPQQTQQLEQMEAQQKRLNLQTTLYRERLKLANEEKKSHLAIERWPCLNQRYQTLELLGKGGYSEVYKCYDLEEDMYVAMKFSGLSDSTIYSDYVKHVHREYVIHKELTHRNIAKMELRLETHEASVTIMEFCEGPQLGNYLKSKGKLEQLQAKVIIKTLLEVLVYLSEKKVIHFDLKPQNIMFHRGVLKVLDFGLAKVIEQGRNSTERTSKTAGTYWYLPPECFKDMQQISNKVDIWSLGVIFFQLLYGVKPFGQNMSQEQVYNQGIILSATDVKFPKRPYVNSQCQDFIRKCLQYQQSKRLSPQQAIQHPYFTDHNLF